VTAVKTCTNGNVRNTQVDLISSSKINRDKSPIDLAVKLPKDGAFMRNQRRKCKKLPLRCPGCGATVVSRCKCKKTFLEVAAKAVPSPRLVGIELNPGPGGKRKRGVGKRKQNSPPRAQPRQKARLGMRAKAGRRPIGGSSKGENKISRSLLISEDEFIGNVNLTSASFTNTQYKINPGDSTTFPWLSTIAANFNKYQFRSLKFYVKRIASEFADAGKIGDIILSCNPDAADPAPVAENQVFDLQMRDNAMPCEDFALNKLSMAELNKQDSFYVRVGAAPANTDIKTYDCGVLNLSTIGTATSGTCGKLFVKYSCFLHSPVLVQPAQGGLVHFSGTVPTTANNFATAALQAGGTPALTGITLGTNIITFPSGIPGNYLVALSVSGSTSTTAIAITPSAGATALSLFTSTTRDDLAYAQSAGGGASVPAMYIYTATVGSSGGLLTLTTPSTIVGGNGMDLFIMSLPTAVLTALPPTARELSVEAKLARLEKAMARLCRDLPDDGSDCESESQIVNQSFGQLTGSSSSSPPVATVALTQSMLGLVTDYVARKSTSNK